MKALVYHGPAARAWEDVPDAAIAAPTDIVMRVDAVTICGTDLHILKGDVPEVEPGTILGHEAVGTVVETGSAVSTLREGDRTSRPASRPAVTARRAVRGGTASAPAAAAGSSAT